MSRPGRPLQVLALAGLALPMWLVVRAPELQRRHRAILAAMAPLEVVALKPIRQPEPAAPDPLFVAATVTKSRKAVRPPVASDEVEHPAPVPTRSGIALPAPDPLERGPGAPPPAAGGTATTAAGPAPAFDLATRAYARLAAGDRRAADGLFAAALVEGADAPQAATWATERRRLNRHWSGDAFMLFRDAGPTGATASPVLGGGQSGATLGYTLDPLARQPLSVIARLNAANDASGLIDANTAQAALGMRFQLLPGVSVAAERLIRVGQATSGDWNVRIAAGGERRVGPATVDGYAEAGARANGDLYAGGQAHAMVAVAQMGPVHVTAGPGTWSSVQTGIATVWRVDAGAGVAASLPGGVTARAEWRWRLAGNAAPDSGPALTIGWGY